MSAKDIVYIQGLRLATRIGVFEWERQIEQNLIFDLEMSHSIESAAVSDQLEDALNYAAISEFIADFARDNHFKLIETFAERLVQQLISQFDLKKVKLKLAKPGAVPDANAVGVIIERSANSF